MNYKASIMERIKYFSLFIIICLLSFTENEGQSVAETAVADIDLIDMEIEANRKASDSLATLAIKELKNFKIVKVKPRIVYVFVTDTVYKKRPFLRFLSKNK